MFSSAFQFAISCSPLLFVPLTLFLLFIAYFFLYIKFLQRFLYTTFFIFLYFFFLPQTHLNQTFVPGENALVNVNTVTSVSPSRPLQKSYCSAAFQTVASPIFLAFWYQESTICVFSTSFSVSSCSSLLLLYVLPEL